MIGRVKNWISFKLAKSIMNELILEGRVPTPEGTFLRLKQSGFKPGIIFDVGAYEGDFTSMCLSLWVDAEIHLFEALPEKIELLKKRFEGEKVIVNETLVGDDICDGVDFFADETASSVLSSEEVYNRKDIIRQRMTTLNDYISKRPNAVPSLLKIDTQGYEFPILLGCRDFLGQIDILLIECNFIEIYKGAAPYSKVFSFLDEYGFTIYDICEIHRRPLDRAMVQADFLFVKKDSFLRKDTRWDHNSF